MAEKEISSGGNPSIIPFLYLCLPLNIFYCYISVHLMTLCNIQVFIPPKERMC